MMDEELKLHAEMARGERARMLLENELLIAAFSGIRESLHTSWVTSPSRDSEGREKIWMMRSLLDSLETHIRSHIETGHLASRHLADLKKRSIFRIK